MSNLLPKVEIRKNTSTPGFFSISMYIPASQLPPQKEISQVLTELFARCSSFSANSTVKIVDIEDTNDCAIIFEEISQILCTLGVPTNLSGYEYLRYAIFASIQNRECLRGITKILYPEIAKKYDSTAPRVERAIRHAIDVSCNRGDPQIIQNFFGNTLNPNSGKPTNTAYISKVADTIRIRQFEQANYSSVLQIQNG